MLRLFYLIALFGSVINTGAQTFKGQQEVMASCGILSGRQMADSHTIDGNGGGIEEISFTENFFVSYRYYLGRRWAIGISAGYQNIQGRMYSNSVFSDGEFISNYSLENKTIAGEMLHEYRNWRNIQFYMLLGLGATFFDYKGYYNPDPSHLYISGYNGFPGFTKKSGTRINCQLSPVCFRFGNKLPCFVETGVGYKGVLNLGCSYSFAKKKASKARKTNGYPWYTPDSEKK